MAIDQYESKLIAIFIQAILYGAFVIMFALTYWVLVHHKPSERPINKPMLGVLIAMFILATMHVIINFVRILQAFITHTNVPGSYWNRLSSCTQILGSTVYIAQTLVGDGVALYRCYVVWGQRFIYILIPLIVFLGSAASGIGILAHFDKLVHVEVFRIRDWILAFFCSTLATSTICTVMIATRIWLLTRRSTGERVGGNLQPIMRVVIESGAIYSGALIVLLVLFITRSWFQYILIDAIPPIIGLVFSFMIVRVGLGISTDGPMSCLDHSNSSSFAAFPNTSPSISGRHKGSALSQPHWPREPQRAFHPYPSHYQLRSLRSRPSSYFRASEEMGIDPELELDLEEAQNSGWPRPDPKQLQPMKNNGVRIDIPVPSKPGMDSLRSSSNTVTF